MFCLEPTEYRSLCEVRPVTQEKLEKNQILDIQIKHQQVESESLNDSNDDMIIKSIETEKNEYHTEDLFEHNNDEKSEYDQSILEDKFCTATNKKQFDSCKALQLKDNEELDIFKEDKATDKLEKQLDNQKSITEIKFVTELDCDLINNKEIEKSSKVKLFKN